jgi:predicted acylesterase/phospholipase RssA
MKVLTILILCLIGTAVAKKKTCRALALEGGGDKGAYQVGAIRGLVEAAKSPSDVAWDVVTGVSIGAVNGAGLSMFAPGDEDEASNYLIEMWRKLKAEDIYQNWYGGIAYGLIAKEGIYDNSPSYDFMSNVFDGFEEGTKRKFSFNAVDANTGDVIVFDESMEQSELAKAVQSSTSMPFAFPHVYMEDMVLVDGGSVWNIDFSTAIQRC